MATSKINKPFTNMYVALGTNPQATGTTKIKVPHMAYEWYLILSGKYSLILNTGNYGSECSVFPISNADTASHTVSYDSNDNSFTITGMTWYISPLVIGRG